MSNQKNLFAAADMLVKEFDAESAIIIVAGYGWGETAISLSNDSELRKRQILTHLKIMRDVEANLKKELDSHKPATLEA